jgi:uncharacterized membrane protein YgaE (UPF0421/DUF939 family)
MNYLTMRLLSFMFKLSGVLSVLLGVLAVLAGVAGWGMLASMMVQIGSSSFRMVPVIIGVGVAIAFVINGILLFGLGDVVDAVADIHETTQTTQAQLYKLITELNAFVKEQRNPKLPATVEAMQDALQNIQFAAKRAASASEEVLAIAQRGRR